MQTKKGIAVVFVQLSIDNNIHKGRTCKAFE